MPRIELLIMHKINDSGTDVICGLYNSLRGDKYTQVNDRVTCPKCLSIIKAKLGPQEDIKAKLKPIDERVTQQEFLDLKKYIPLYAKGEISNENYYIMNNIYRRLIPEDINSIEEIMSVINMNMVDNAYKGLMIAFDKG
jgi:hypothetical protein